MTGDCGRTNSGYGGIEKRVQISPLHSSEQPPLRSPWGLSLYCPDIRGERGNDRTPCPSAFSQSHFYLCGAVPGGGDCLVSPKCLLALIQLLSQRAKEGIASDHSLKMHLRERILLQTVL